MAKAHITDWNRPDYGPVFRERSERLEKIRRDDAWKHAWTYYRQNPIDYIEDWLVTFDPRRIPDGKPPAVPFLLFPRQRQFIAWLHDRLDRGESGIVEKSRDVGISWLMLAFALWAYTFIPGAKVGFGSYKNEKVDRLGDMDGLFEKLRFMIRSLPRELRPLGYDEAKHATFMRVTNPENGAAVTGEGGPNVGRGGRSMMYFVDEFAHFDNDSQADAALSQNTTVRIYASTVNGAGNLFYRKRFSGDYPVFVFDWRDDPRKGPDWYALQRRTLEPHILAQEVDRDYHASVTRTVIPAAWVRAAQEIVTVIRRWPKFHHGVGGGDVGAGGSGKTTFSARFGPFVDSTLEWNEADTTNAAKLLHDAAIKAGVSALNFDSIGVGEGVASTLRRLQDESDIQVSPINVGLPASDRIWPDGKRAKEKFANQKAELWWTARDAFQKTYERLLFERGEDGGVEHPLDELVVLHPQDHALASQLSLPTWGSTQTGKILIESKEALRRRGVPSPDHAEAFVLTYSAGAGRLGTADIEGLY